MRDTHDTRDFRMIPLIYAGNTRDTLDLRVIYAWYLEQLPIRMIPVIYARYIWFTQDVHMILLICSWFTHDTWYNL